MKILSGGTYTHSGFRFHFLQVFFGSTPSGPKIVICYRGLLPYEILLKTEKNNPLKEVFSYLYHIYHVIKFRAKYIYLITAQAL